MKKRLVSKQMMTLFQKLKFYFCNLTEYHIGLGKVEGILISNMPGCHMQPYKLQ